MPTGADNAVVPVRRPTKRGLDRLRADATYDEALRLLLRQDDEADVRDRLQRERERECTRVRAWRDLPRGVLRRSPTKQTLIADLAARRWDIWRREGRVERIGPRRYRWNVPGPSDGGVRAVRRPGRGLSP